MTYNEESYVLDTLKEVSERIRDMPDLKLLAKEVHENNLMLRQIVKVINTYIARHHQENEDDFNRNILANLISSGFDFKTMFKRNGNNK